jgi:hypothetical protein
VIHGGGGISFLLSEIKQPIVTCVDQHLHPPTPPSFFISPATLCHFAITTINHPIQPTPPNHL